jgi:hypothetical protein
MTTCAGGGGIRCIAGRDATEPMTLEEAAFGQSVVIHAMDWTLVLLDE